MIRVCNVLIQHIRRIISKAENLCRYLLLIGLTSEVLHLSGSLAKLQCQKRKTKTGESETVDCLRWLAGGVESFGQDLTRGAVDFFLPSFCSSLLSQGGVLAQTLHT
jgi:hypothetical protein